MKKLVMMAGFAAFLFSSGPAGFGQTIALERGFKHVPDSVKPGCYYYWINDNVNAEGVVKDIQAMARVGIGRAYIGNVGFDGSPGYGQGKLFFGGLVEGNSRGGKGGVPAGSRYRPLQ